MAAVPVSREFTIIEILGEPIQSQGNNNVRLVCETAAGEQIVIWGTVGIAMDHIEAILRASLPVRIRCGCIHPKEWGQELGHRWWIPDSAPLEVLSPATACARQEPNGLIDEKLQNNSGLYILPPGDPARRFLVCRGKYRNLKDYLDKADSIEVNLSFSKIEEILEDQLPPSARTWRPWWANDLTHSQAKAWMLAGYEVSNVHVCDDGHVTFKLNAV